MADEKRQGVMNGIWQRTCMFLFGMMKLARNSRCAPRPEFNPGHKQPPARHRTQSHAGVPAGICDSATGKRGNADPKEQKNDTKSASHCTIRIYARHQMEQSEVNAAGNHLPDSPHQGVGEPQGAKNDTKSTSPVNIRGYARHQMERHDFPAAEGRQMLLCEIRSAGHHFPDSGRSGRWETAVGEKRHQIGKFI
ncbi:MAG: hypothetical protein GXY38_05590 [Planctomycetes bacterium]|nr:hypothetical protein [Planctomycetota bacterium]